MAAALGDVDSDGDLDLVVANASGPNRLLLNDGHGIFTDVTDSRLPALSQVSMSAQLGDVDGDGDLDLVVANRGSQNRLWLNDGTGVFTDATATHLPSDSALSYDVEFADVDGNHTLDLVVANHGTPNQLLRNNGLGVFTDVTTHQLPMISGTSMDALFCDIDADGDADLLVTAGSPALRVFLNDGTGRFTDATATHLPALDAFGIKVLAGDIDSDGDADLVLAAAGQDRILLNDGSGHFTDATADFLPKDTNRSFGIALFDADQDLDLDLLLGTPQGPNRFLLNVVTFPRLRLAVIPAYKEVGSPVTLTAEAFDEDGLASAVLTLTKPAGQEQSIDLSADLADRQATSTFTPTIPGTYTATLSAVDVPGNTQTNRVTFVVVAHDTAVPQVSIAIDPPAPILLGHTVSLRVTSTDDHDIVHSRLTIHGASVPLDSTGLATYTPAAPGVYTAIAQATDAAGNVGTAETTFAVEADTAPPLVSIRVTPEVVTLSQPVHITVEATDNIAVMSRTLRVSGPAIPDGLDVVLNEAGEAIYTPFQPGIYTLTAAAQDPSGHIGTATATFNATGTADTTPPVVSLTATPTLVPLGEAVTLTITATDDTDIATTTLEVNDTPFPLDSMGMATYVPSTAGAYTAIAVARDGFGNTNNAQTTFRVIDPADDSEPPFVNIAAPAPDTSLTVPTAIVGTVRDATLVRYTLAYSPHGEERFTTFATGSTEVNERVLGTLDTSLLLNDLYDIRLTAEDILGRASVTMVTYQVTGNLKIGHFSFTLQDLLIPVVGLPMSIDRTYDSRDKTEGDFGIGWRLAVQSVKVRENRVLGSGWQQGRVSTFTYCIQPEGQHYVAIALPDGRTETFDLTLEPSCQPLLPIEETTVSFTPRPGTLSRLEAVSDNTLLVVGSLTSDVGTMSPVDLVQFGSDDLGQYDPSRYRLTTPEGVVFELDQSFGVRTITESNGNTLSFTPNGLLHSAGKSVNFIRDAAGRITQITDPNGNTLTYTYDAHGDLVAVTEPAGQITQYHYNTSHGLIAIEDPRGIMPAQNIYNDAGRLIAHVDAEGHRIEYTHDIEARQETVRDRLGHVTVYIYDDAGNVLSQTDPFGQTTTFTYDDHGNTLSTTDPLGQTTTFSYDDHGNLLTERNALGQTTTYTYNSHNQLLTVTNPLGHTTNNTYSATGNLLSTSDPLGQTTTFSYDAHGNPLTTTDPLGQTTTFTYDAAGNLLTFTNPLGRATTYTYDANGNPLTRSTTRTDATGNRITMTTIQVYDRQNRVVQTIDPEGNTTVVEYDEIGQVKASTDKNGNRTAYAYDTLGNLVHTTYADGTAETATYDPQGNRRTFTDRAGRTTQYVYDALNRLIRTTWPQGSSDQTTYDAVGRVVSSNDATLQADLLPIPPELLPGVISDGTYSSFSYDAADRLTAVMDALGQSTTFAYDADGRLMRVTDANGHTTEFVYDASNRRIRTLFADGSETRQIYDRLDRVLANVDQAGQMTQFAYDSQGRLTQVIDALGNVTIYRYDEVGNLLSQTDANGHTSHWTYDNLHRVSTHTLPLGMTEAFTYDPHGNVLTRSDFNGETTAYTYDSNNRVTLKTASDGTHVAYTYTPVGQRATVTDDRGVTSYRYDPGDRLLAVTHPHGTTLTYAYDTVGNRSTVRTPSGTTSYSYDARQRLQTVTDPQGGVTSYTYDAVGNRTHTTYPHGARSAATYDPLNRLVSLAHTKSDGTPIASYTYTLGPTGQRLQIAEENGRTVDYTYDALYRLVREDIHAPLVGDQTIAYTYDAVGNRLTKTDVSETTYTYDANDRLLTTGSTIYNYDHNGNTVSQTEAGQGTTFAYDVDNRLRSVQSPSSVIGYTYDADGIRVNTTVDGVVTHYVVDANREYAQVVEAQDASGALLSRYVYGDTLISQQWGEGTSFYHTDALGSIRILTNLDETITDTYIYDAFGTSQASTGSTPNPYRFAGEQFDPPSGLYYLRARYAHPGMGRFLSADPFAGNLASPVTRHQYLYAQADPVNKRDPSGQVTLAEMTIANSIRNILMEIQTTTGFGLLDLSSDGEDAAFVNLALGIAMPVIGIVARPLIRAARAKVHAGGWLHLHEGPGLGHTLARHVGLSDSALIKRLMDSKKINTASSFAGISIAEQAIRDAFRAPENKVAIRNWLKSDRYRNGKGHIIEYDIGKTIGRVIYRGQTVVTDSTKLRITLAPVGKSGKFFIRTAYPY
jgi:RHS repeat-associated protein